MKGPLGRARRALRGTATSATADSQSPQAFSAADLAALAEACTRVANGDLEVRIPPIGQPGSPLAQIREAVNALIDVIDAYVRESHAALAAASTGAFERAFLTQGMPGAFRDGARRINAARAAMHASVEQAEQRTAVEREMARHTYEASQLLAAAATQLGSSADSLNSFAAAAVAEARNAVQTVDGLERSSGEIEQATAVITRVAAQTRLLSLNATIEASRAGEAGRGFAVVAQEVKALADEVARAAEGISSQVRTAQAGSTHAIEVIQIISRSIEEMGQLVDQISVAANGSAGTEGLAQMAERLHADTGRLLADSAALR